jgi:hypothetical protein
MHRLKHSSRHSIRLTSLSPRRLHDSSPHVFYAAHRYLPKELPQKLLMSYATNYLVLSVTPSVHCLDVSPYSSQSHFIRSRITTFSPGTMCHAPTKLSSPRPRSSVLLFEVPYINCSFQRPLRTLLLLLCLLFTSSYLTCHTSQPYPKCNCLYK